MPFEEPRPRSETICRVIWRAIEEDATVIILSNSEHGGNVGKTGKELLELLLNAR